MLTAEERRERYARQDTRMTSARRRRLLRKDRHANLTGDVGQPRRAHRLALAARAAAHRAWVRSMGQ